METINKYFNFRILGEVKAKQSFKFGANGVKYTPADVKNYAKLVKYSFIKDYPRHTADDLKDHYITIKIYVFKKYPKSFSEKKILRAKQGYILPDKKPDWDNIAKNICDALNGVAYPDDRAIIKGVVEKYYAYTDYVNVEIKATRFIDETQRR